MARAKSIKESQEHQFKNVIHAIRELEVGNSALFHITPEQTVKIERKPNGAFLYASANHTHQGLPLAKLSAVIAEQLQCIEGTAANAFDLAQKEIKDTYDPSIALHKAFDPNTNKTLARAAKNMTPDGVNLVLEDGKQIKVAREKTLNGRNGEAMFSYTDPAGNQLKYISFKELSRHISKNPQVKEAIKTLAKTRAVPKKQQGPAGQTNKKTTWIGRGIDLITDIIKSQDAEPETTNSPKIQGSPAHQVSYVKKIEQARQKQDGASKTR